jgi:hypothetical protein
LARLSKHANDVGCGDVKYPLWNFAVVGVQKGGTTSLTSHMMNHPQLCVEGEVRLTRLFPHRTALEMDGWPNLTATRTFCGSRCPQMMGVVDPVAAYFPTFMPEETSFLPHLHRQPEFKLLMLLREPLQRAFSAFMMGRDRGFRFEFPYRNFDELVAVEADWLLPSFKPPPDFMKVAFIMRPSMQGSKRGERRLGPATPKENLRLGLYASMLAAFEKAGFVCPGPRLHIAVSERLQTKGTDELSRIWRFLGVDTMPTKSSFDRVGSYRTEGGEESQGNSTPIAISAWAKRTLYAAYHQSTEKVYAVLGERIGEWEGWYAANGLGQPGGTSTAAANERHEQELSRRVQVSIARLKICVVHAYTFQWLAPQLANLAKHAGTFEYFAHVPSGTTDAFKAAMRRVMGPSPQLASLTVMEQKHAKSVKDDLKHCRQLGYAFSSCDHMRKLDEIARAACLGDEQSSLLFLDSDSWPTDGLKQVGLGSLSPSVPLVAVQRSAEALGWFPHPSFALTTCGLWQQYNLTWHPHWPAGTPYSPEDLTFRDAIVQDLPDRTIGGHRRLIRGVYKDASDCGRPAKDTPCPTMDTGMNVWFALRQLQLEWIPLIRTNTFNLHNVYYGVYGCPAAYSTIKQPRCHSKHAAYHHGGGTRGHNHQGRYTSTLSSHMASSGTESIVYAPTAIELQLDMSHHEDIKNASIELNQLVWQHYQQNPETAHRIFIAPHQNLSLLLTSSTHIRELLALCTRIRNQYFDIVWETREKLAMNPHATQDEVESHSLSTQLWLTCNAQ